MAQGEPLTAEELSSWILVRLPGGLHAFGELSGANMHLAYHELDIAPEMRNALSAVFIMYQALEDQRRGLERLINMAETIGGAAEGIVPAFVALLSSCDLGQRAARVGASVVYEQFSNARKPL